METKRLLPQLQAALHLLPIREAYEWKPEALAPRGAKTTNLLPIREAYEWKRFSQKIFDRKTLSCFQFVKRMNGNEIASCIARSFLRLASNS